MGIIQMKNVPDDLHDELRRRASRAGMTVRDYVIALIARDQRRPAFDEWLAEVAVRRAGGDDGVAGRSGPGGPPGAGGGERSCRSRAWRSPSLTPRYWSICSSPLRRWPGSSLSGTEPFAPELIDVEVIVRDRPHRPSRRAPRRSAGRLAVRRLARAGIERLPLAPLLLDAWALRRRSRPARGLLRRPGPPARLPADHRRPPDRGCAQSRRCRWSSPRPSERDRDACIALPPADWFESARHPRGGGREPGGMSEDVAADRTARRQRPRREGQALPLALGGSRRARRRAGAGRDRRGADRQGAGAARRRPARRSRRRARCATTCRACSRRRAARTGCRTPPT